MKLTTLSLLISSAALAQTLQIDSAHSAANFAVKHMMVSTVRGTLGKITGTVNYDAANLSASKVSATIDMKAINTNEPKRDAHLRSADFFDAEQFPTLTFESTKWWKEGSNVKVAGNLTMRGVTKPVTLDVEISPAVKGPQGVRLGAQATTKLNRKDWGVNWSRALDGGGLVVSDEVAVTLDLEATGK